MPWSFILKSKKSAGGQGAAQTLDQRRIINATPARGSAAAWAIRQRRMYATNWFGDTSHFAPF